MELECAQDGAALLIPGAAWRYPIAVAGELLLPLLRIPEGEWRLAQFSHSGLVWPGADAMVKGQLAPGEVGAGILLAFGGYVAVGQHLGGGDLVAIDQLPAQSAESGDLGPGIGVASASGGQAGIRLPWDNPD